MCRAHGFVRKYKVTDASRYDGHELENLIDPDNTASIVAGLPIAVILLVMVYGIARSLHEDFPVPDIVDRISGLLLSRSPSRGVVPHFEILINALS